MDKIEKSKLLGANTGKSVRIKGLWKWPDFHS